MKNRFLKSVMYGAAATAFTFAGCSNNDDPAPENPINPPIENRWITVAGALMGSAPGDGNGGTMVYSVSKEDAQNSETAINVYENGFSVRSNRTARLQSSVDGSVLFNIAYTGDNGGEFSRYRVNGADGFVQEDATVNISQYASTSPRWVKLFDGDKTGVAVNVANIQANNAEGSEGVGNTFAYYRGTATILAVDLQEVLISGYKQYQLPLSAEEELAGHTIFRLDAPVLNRAGDKLIVGTWMRKYNVATGQTETDFERLGTKSVVVDYPSLENPTVITSAVGFGDCSGYRSFNSFLSEDGSIYQATQRDPNGSHILRIDQNNQYDNSYTFSLDAALGVPDVYVEAWRYASNGIAYVLYSHSGLDQGYIARVDLNARTATQVNIPYDADLSFGQYQGFVVDGEDVYVAVTPTGKDGHIYILNSATGAVTQGARLVNRPGNHYIGIY